MSQVELLRGRSLKQFFKGIRLVYRGNELTSLLLRPHSISQRNYGFPPPRERRRYYQKNGRYTEQTGMVIFL